MYLRLILCLFVYILPAQSFAVEQTVTLVHWGSLEGIKRLERSAYKADFFPLANHFESQENKAYCGLASSTIVLNALRLDNPAIRKPQDNSLLPESKRRYFPQGFDPVFERYTQNTLYNAATKSEMQVLGKPVTINGKKVSDYGFQLKELAQLLTSHGLDVTTRVATDELQENTIRKELAKNLKTLGDYVLVNYYRQTLGQEGTGHISPLGAYDAASDSFLIMDVNPNTAEWVWVKTADLIAAMKVADIVENRGYVLIQEGKKSTR